MEEFDVLIVGAGISGIGAACHMKMEAPNRSFAILEGRARKGGTWDLFRYPGIRSDSDMHTLGFAFKPWTHDRSIADAPAILGYLEETAREYRIESAIRYEHRVVRIEWNSAQARWSVEVKTPTGTKQLRCRFLYMGTGYYSYSDPYQPEFAGRETFKGKIVHPQFWPENFNFKGKRTVVIGSGATAVTIVPAMVGEGVGHVTMLQRSPTWFVSRPAKDRIANVLRKFLPDKLAYEITRLKNVTLQQYFYNRTQQKPKKVRAELLELTTKQLPAGYDVATHFTPRYNPWEQRLCLVPDADFFKAIHSGKAEVVTDHIERFDETGIVLKSGKHLEADIIVTATGLNMEIMSSVMIVIDGVETRVNEHFSYKGCLYSDIPNLASAFGYSNASWTLKADLISSYVCRLLNHMKATGTDIAVAIPQGVKRHEEGMMNLSSGYVQRAKEKVPMQGDVDPWKIHHNYPADKKLMKYGKLEDGTMRFFRAGEYRANIAERELAVAAE